MSGKSKGRFIEEQAFYDGTQGVGTDAGLTGIDARCAEQQARVRGDAASRCHRLEAEIESLTQRQADTAGHWRKLEARTDGLPPQVVQPLLAILSAVAASYGEAILLASVMDGFGIADLDDQRLAAGVLVFCAGGFCKLAMHMLGLAADQQSPEHPGAASRAQQIKQIVIKTLLVCFTLALVFALGSFRAGEMIFAASLQHTALGRFFGEHRGLTNWTVTLLTVALPVYAAAALNWGLAGLRLARAWRNARRAFRRDGERLNQKRKALAAFAEQRDCRIAALEHQRREWASVYLREYQLGQRIGARRQPLWQVAIKISAVAAGILAIWLWLDPVPLPSPIAKGFLAMLATAALGGGYAYCVLQAWERPAPEQVYQHRAVIWREDERWAEEAITPGVAQSIEQANAAAPREAQVGAAYGNGNHPSARRY
ncbi:MAG TPA: hypothetical protein VJ464_23860 [Blastocatellia bacterium]|nr:hypothetical protein [Blastocatellia bacterium]